MNGQQSKRYAYVIWIWRDSLKQVIYYYLCLKVLIKAFAGGYLFITDSTGLPPIVFGVCAVLVLAGGTVAFRSFKNKTKLNEIALFFIAEIVATVFNLIFVSQGTLIESGIWDMFVTGSLFDIILAATIVFFTVKRKSAYINMGKQSFAPQSHEVTGKIR